MTVDARFCPRCGGPLAKRPPTACGTCGYTLFVNARPTASLIVHDGGRFLALKRAQAPQAGLWETPGGFCDGWEEPAAAAVREGREELGVEVTLGDFVGMYVGCYDYQGERLPVLDCFYLATLDGAEITLNAEESSDMTWFDLDKPPPLAFRTMDRAVQDAARRLAR
ncbi:NUDIX domain-containing protein [Actinomycetes bacterium KLBMP 9797]